MMTNDEINRFRKMINDWFDGVTDNGNTGSPLFWDIYLISEEINKELRESYLNHQITNSDVDRIKALFNERMDEVIDIRIKEGV